MGISGLGWNHVKNLVNELDKCIEVLIRMIEGKGKSDSNKNCNFSLVLMKVLMQSWFPNKQLKETHMGITFA